MMKMRESNRFTEEQLKEIEPLLKRQIERSTISGEFIRSRIMDKKLQVSQTAPQTNNTQQLNESVRFDSKYEYQRIMRELRSRSTIEIVKD